ncbi:hypothetical protein BpHYR1_005291 [Brachionus plicatilis]|uniref:C2H2-type domain-containing protein n=1 Tax=Brachionus plicatilis TaxID=10195 RepID=A0A3M7S680_BRAPC|nr:hypothetical protein BpHYR1_005291 [Brachionus plicatilis]
MSPFCLIFILTFGSLSFGKPCSRAQSKFVREYFARSLLPVYQKHSQPIPEACPFSPARDMYHFHENNKTKLDIFRWKCELCGKIFAKESDLDKHFDSRHANTLQTVPKYNFFFAKINYLNKGKNSVCLANYCRIFRCGVLINQKVEKTQCYQSTMNILKNKCNEHIDHCVPKGAPLSIQNKLTSN